MEFSRAELRDECDRAAREFLSVRGWPCTKSKVEEAVAEIRAGTRLASSSMGWLLNQMAKVPINEEPARRLNDLVQALAALRDSEAEAANPTVLAT